MRRLRSLGEKNRDVPLISMGGQMDDFFARLQKRTKDGAKLPTWCVAAAVRSDNSVLETDGLRPVLGTASCTLSSTAARTRRMRLSRRATARSASRLSPRPFECVRPDGRDRSALLAPSEYLLKDLEYAATLASILGDASYRYPKKDLDWCWEQLLLCQFHDTLPGSSHRCLDRLTSGS
jgi:hypothetical protein